MPRQLPSRDEVLELFRDENRVFSSAEIATALNVAPGSERGLVRLLDNLVLSGELEGEENEHFSLPRSGKKKPPPVELKGVQAPAPKHKPKKGLPSKADRGAGGQRFGKNGASDRKADVKHPRQDLGLGSSANANANDATAMRTGKGALKGAPPSDPELPSWSMEGGETSNRRTRSNASSEEREGLLSISPRGFGFVAHQGATGDDVYIAKESIAGGMHGDRVRIAIVRRTARGLEGEVIAILDRKSKRVAGTLRRRGKSAWLEPDDARLRGPIPLPAQVDSNAGEGNSGNDGDAAVVSITRYPELPDELPEGKLEAVLGRPGELNVEVAKILVREQIEELHTPEAFSEAEAYGPTVPDSMLAGREDLTHIPLPTIDPEDARDHDDAVWVERSKLGGYKVYVAIADVSSYVTPGTRLDAEALLRGCTIYLPDRAIPMLPRPLSSNLCSLLPDVIRLCLCVEIEMNAAGETVRSRIIRGYMKSAAKLTYQSVARALGLTEIPAPDPKAEAMVDGLRVAHELSKILRAKRMKRGALDLDLPEAKITLGENGLPVSIGKRANDPGVRQAYQLIEELMLLANETVAQFFQEKNLTTVYRVHAPPDVQKLERFARLCEALSIPFDIEEAQDPKNVSALLKTIADHPQANVLRMLLLRSLKQATYDVVNIGHFGLASKAYLHFTSPIRRYPDLLVHRGAHAVVLGRKRAPDDDAQLADAARISSENERRAMEIEREVTDIYRCIFMRDHVGERFEGTVTALVGTGAYVALDDPFVDVLVRFDDLSGDRYEIDDDGLSAVSERTRDVIRLGDRMLVEIVDAAIVRRTVYGKRASAPNRLEGDAPRAGNRATARGGSRDKDGRKARAAHAGKSDKAGRSKDPRDSKRKGKGSSSGSSGSRSVAAPAGKPARKGKKGKADRKRSR